MDIQTKQGQTKTVSQVRYPANWSKICRAGIGLSQEKTNGITVCILPDRSANLEVERKKEAKILASC